MSSFTTHRNPTHRNPISKKQKIYEKKLQIFTNLIINEYECEKNAIDLIIRGFSNFTDFQIEMKSKLWEDGSIRLGINITDEWKVVKATIDEAILKVNELEEGLCGRCPCCYEDLKDAAMAYGCSVCSAIICNICADIMRDETKSFKCPICRTDAHLF